MIEHCKHCGNEIVKDLVPPHSSHWWRTGWHHRNGYEHCNPDPSSYDSSRAEPNDQMRMI